MKNFIKKIGAVFLSLTVAASLLAGCGAKTTEPADASASKGIFRTLEEIKSSGTINIGVFSDKSPFGYVDENGEYQGYDVYFANRIGEDLGVKINYVSTEAANRIEYLQTGKVDIILANFTVTPERAQEVDFALPYMNVALGVVSPEDAVITSLDEIGADDQDLRHHRRDLSGKEQPRDQAAEVRRLRRSQDRLRKRQRRGLGQRQHRSYRFLH